MRKLSKLFFGIGIFIICFLAMGLIWDSVSDNSGLEKKVVKGSAVIGEEDYGHLHEGYVVFELNKYGFAKKKTLRYNSSFDEMKVREEWQDFPKSVRECYFDLSKNMSSLIIFDQHINDVCFGYTTCRKLEDGSENCVRVIPYTRYGSSLKILDSLYKAGWIEPVEWQENEFELRKAARERYEKYRFIDFRLVQTPTHGQIYRWELIEEEKINARNDVVFKGAFLFIVVYLIMEVIRTRIELIKT